MTDYKRKPGRFYSKLEKRLDKSKEYVSSSIINNETGNIPVDSIDGILVEEISAQKLKSEGVYKNSNNQTIDMQIDEAYDLEAIKEKYRLIVEKRKIAYHAKKRYNRAKNYFVHRKTHSLISSTIFRIKESYKDTIDDFIFVKKSLGPKKEGEDKYSEINIYKFRTMVPGTDDMFNELAQVFGLDDKGNLRYDPRITKHGAKARKYWIDELPQIINILRGELKIVGIRPRSEEQWKEFSYKEEALKYIPGFGGEQYVMDVAKYLKEYAIHPLRTDSKVIAMLAYKIIFKGLRSA